MPFQHEIGSLLEITKCNTGQGGIELTSVLVLVYQLVNCISKSK